MGDFWTAAPVILVFLRISADCSAESTPRSCAATTTRSSRPAPRWWRSGPATSATRRAFVADEHIPFPVLVDDDASAATAAALKRVNFATLLFDPRSLQGARRAHRDGFRVRKSGKRVTQLGATFVLGPGPHVRYAHVDAHTADHARRSQTCSPRSLYSVSVFASTPTAGRTAL